VLSTAWFELVPAPSQTIRFKVDPGDTVTATVTVAGHKATISLKDWTRKRTFTRTVRAASIDVSSAEWIAEAPSDCISPTSCQTLPLADFGSTTFGFASVQSTRGRVGTISNSGWRATKIMLIPGGRRYVVNQGGGIPVGTASPSDLTANGSAFKVTYSQVFVQPNPNFTARASAATAGRLVHPAR
jgi:hypothetical protein